MESRHAWQATTIVAIVVAVAALGVAIVALSRPRSNTAQRVSTAEVSTQSKAHEDAAAQEQARTLETAAETASTDNNGSYALVNIGKLEEVEPTLSDHGTATPTVPIGERAEEYEVASRSNLTGDTFKIKRLTTGIIERSCEPENTGGCLTGGKW